MLRYLDRAPQSYRRVRCCGKVWFVGPAHEFASEMADRPVRSAQLQAIIREHVWSGAFREAARKHETQSIEYVRVNVYDMAARHGRTPWRHDIAEIHGPKYMVQIHGPNAWPNVMSPGHGIPRNSGMGPDAPACVHGVPGKPLACLCDPATPWRTALLTCNLNSKRG